MDDLESKLKGLSLRAPSRELDDRVLRLKPERPSHGSRAGWRVPLWFAVAISFVVGCAGFVGGAIWRNPLTPAKSETSPAVRVEWLIDTSSSSDPFDFTSASADSPVRDWEMLITTGTDAST